MQRVRGGVVSLSTSQHRSHYCHDLPLYRYDYHIYNKKRAQHSNNYDYIYAAAVPMDVIYGRAKLND